MALKKKTYINGQTVISAENLNDIQDEIIGTKTADGTVVSQNADFAEVAEWDDGNPNNEDRTGYFVCANVPLNGIVMKKATSLDDVKGVSILAPAFAGNYTADKLDSEGNLLPKYSFVAVLGFVPVIDNGTCTVGGRCMPDDNGCAIPSSNSMGYQVVNRIDENRVLIIIEPNGDMVQRIKTRVNELQEDIDNLAPDQIYSPESENAQSGKAVAEALKSKVLVDVTLTEEQVASGISGISVAIEDIEAYHNAKQVNIYVEMPFKDKALPSSTININVSDVDGAAYADYFGWQYGVTCPQGNTLYWHIFNVRESFHTSNNKKKMCSYYRSPTYYEEPNSLGTCSCLYDGVTHLANLKDHPPKLNLCWSSGGATLEAGTRIFVEVYE